VSGAIIHDPEHTAGGLVGFLAHDFTDEACYRRNAILRFTTPEDLGAVDIPSGQINPGTLAKILVFNPGGTVRRGMQSRMFPATSLNAGLFVCGNDVVIVAQWDALPNALVKVEDGSGFVGELRIAREDPASMLPGAKGIGAEPAPQRGAADLCHQALGNDVLTDLLNREPG